MKIIQNEHGLRLIDSKPWIGVFTLFLTLLAGVEFVQHILRGAPLRETLPLLLGAFLAGGAGAALCQSSDFLFDLTERKVTWARRSLFGARHGVILFNEIEFAVVQCMRGTSRRLNVLYRLALITSDGVIPLTISYTGQANDHRYREVRTAINQLLGIHLPSEDDNDIRQLVLQGQRLWAEAMAAQRYRLNSTQANELAEHLIAQSD